MRSSEGRRVYRQLKGVRRELKEQARRIERELSRVSLTEVDQTRLRELEDSTERLAKAKTRLRKRFQGIRKRGPYKL